MTYPTGEEYAFSLNRLLDGWTSAVVRIRAGSTSDEIDLKLSSGDLVTDDINEDPFATWVGAQTGNDGSAHIVTFYDQSGNGYDATQSVAGAQATLKSDGTDERQNYADFDGGDYYALGDRLVLDGYTILAVCKFDTTSFQFLFGSNASNSLRWYLGVGQSSGKYFIRNGTSGYTSSSSTASTSDMVWLSRGTGSTGATRVDGTEVVSQAYTTTGTPAVQTMGQAGTQGFYFTGRVYEIIAWNSSLSDGDRDAAEGEAEAYYWPASGTTYYETISVSTAGVLTITDTFSFVRTISPAATATPTLTRVPTLSRVISAVCTVAPSVTLEVAKPLTAAATAVVSMTKKIIKSIGVVALGTPSVSTSSAFKRSISASTTASLVLARAREYTQSVLASTTGVVSLALNELGNLVPALWRDMLRPIRRGLIRRLTGNIDPPYGGEY